MVWKGSDSVAEVVWQRLAEVTISAEMKYFWNNKKYLANTVDNWLANYDNDHRDAATTTKRRRMKMTNTTEFTTISISMDGVWAGSGKLVEGKIRECGAQFCDDQDETEVIYEMIEERIAKFSKQFMTLDLDGRDRLIEWSIVQPN